MLILALAATAATPMFEAPAVLGGDETWRAAAATVDRAALELTATSCLAKIKTATQATTLTIAVSRSSADRTSIQVTGTTTPDAAEASCMRLVGEQVGRGVQGAGELSIEAKLPALPIVAPVSATPATTAASDPSSMRSGIGGLIGARGTAFLGPDGKPLPGLGAAGSGATTTSPDRSAVSGINVGAVGATPAGAPGSDDLAALQAATPPLGYGSPIILGALDSSLVLAGVDTERSALVTCNAAAESGVLVVKFVIAKDGSVSSATVKRVSESLSGTLQTCAITAFQRMRFPEPRGGGIVIVSWPLLYRPS